MLLRRRNQIFDKLAELSDILLEAAEQFHKIVHNWEYTAVCAPEMKRLERNADELVHDITDETEKTFILPLDKEDIQKLTNLLDDVIDNLEEAANRFCIYGILDTNEPLKELSDLLLQAAGQVRQNVVLLKDDKMFSKEYSDGYKKLHSLENQGDRLHRIILEKLMGRSSDEFDGDPISIIKWKEIFQTIEDTLDICEDMAIVFERLRIKYR